MITTKTTFNAIIDIPADAHVLSLFHEPGDISTSSIVAWCRGKRAVEFIIALHEPDRTTIVHREEYYNKACIDLRDSQAAANVEQLARAHAALLGWNPEGVK